MVSKYFPNPFEMEGEWFKGNLHAHTTQSDGSLSPLDVCKLYKAYGYDFLFITDHRDVTPIRDLSKSLAGNFLVFKGIELDVPSSEIGTKYHIIGLNVKNKIEYRDPQKCINEILREGGEALIAHPYWSSLTVHDLLKIRGYLGIEIYNTHCHYSVSKGFSTVHWDDLLSRKHYVLGFAVDDAHWYKDKLPMDACGAWIMVKAPSLSEDSIMNSIRRGLFYSSTGPEFFDIKFNDEEIYVKCSPVTSISFISRNGLGFRFNAEGNTITEISCPLDNFEVFLRIELESSDGGKAWINPIMLSE